MSFNIFVRPRVCSSFAVISNRTFFNLSPIISLASLDNARSVPSGLNVLPYTLTLLSSINLFSASSNGSTSSFLPTLCFNLGSFLPFFGCPFFTTSASSLLQNLCLLANSSITIALVLSLFDGFKTNTCSILLPTLISDTGIVPDFFCITSKLSFNLSTSLILFIMLSLACLVFCDCGGVVYLPMSFERSFTFLVFSFFTCVSISLMKDSSHGVNSS